MEKNTETETKTRTRRDDSEKDPSFWEKHGDSIKGHAANAATIVGAGVAANVIKERLVDPLLDRGKEKAKEKAAEQASNLFRRSGGGFFRR